ncbi:MULTISPECIES: VTT domain-containing protein [unclassified Haloferax]|uniref:DedA family protein n=1 Tax=unclassified Haloferax TaxID=2625095 RepID=UPI002876FDA5|nr:MULTISPECIES: VTT domain-containing protein [unclassified Haloferax]MDS0242555.1 VTT domain-containing protein [Haloferax sp. S2CR25]MDS0445676.1 VTT domain-containing protein [Haloferax sp. S2CR25-2]
MSAFTAQLPDFLRDLLASDLALVALFLVFVLEGAMLLYVAPSELLVPGALALVGERLLIPILAVAVLGATVGQVALFLVAKRGGREYLLSRSWFRVGEDSLDRFDGWFDRWGPVVVPLSNAMLFTRGMLTVPAGLSGMSAKRFVALSALGTVVFESALAALYVFGGQVLA